MFHRNIKDNVLITYMKFYENCMATLVAMATVHEKFQMTFPMKVLSQFKYFILSIDVMNIQY